MRILIDSTRGRVLKCAVLHRLLRLTSDVNRWCNNVVSGMVFEVDYFNDPEHGTVLLSSAALRLLEQSTYRRAAIATDRILRELNGEVIKPGRPFGTAKERPLSRRREKLTRLIAPYGIEVSQFKSMTGARMDPPDYISMEYGNERYIPYFSAVQFSMLYAPNKWRDVAREGACAVWKEPFPVSALMLAERLRVGDPGEWIDTEQKLMVRGRDFEDDGELMGVSYSGAASMCRRAGGLEAHEVLLCIDFLTDGKLRKHL